MKQIQKTIALWMKRVLQMRDWTPEQWAREAGVAPTSITRAMRDSYDGVSSLMMVDKLARAASVPSPLDALQPDVICLRPPESTEMIEKVSERMRKHLHDVLLEQIAESLADDRTQ